jgi:hypothetical protein
MIDENRELLLKCARALEDLREDLVFVGGCTTGLLITDPAAADIRSTRDVDVIAEVGSRGEYYALENESARSDSGRTRRSSAAGRAQKSFSM